MTYTPMPDIKEITQKLGEGFAEIIMRIRPGTLQSEIPAIVACMSEAANLAIDMFQKVANEKIDELESMVIRHNDSVGKH